MTQLPGEHGLVSITPTHGIDQILVTLGDIFAYIREDHILDPRWQAEQLVTIPLPFPLPLSWDRSRQVERLTCHKLLQSSFESVFQAISKAGLQSKITSFGGCFSFRPQRTGNKLSAHSWGIAIDLNPRRIHRARPATWTPESPRYSSMKASPGAESGREERAIPCTFNSARDTN